MDDERIKGLAQTYVNELFAHDNMTDQENIEDKKDALALCISFAEYIQETHCIVPKESLDKHYTEMAKDYARYLDPDNGANQRMIEVDSLGFLNLVMGKYCLVDKSKVREKYALCKMGYTECEGVELGYVMDALEEIFDKDVLNDTDK